MKIAIIGTGYVGLVTGACLSDFGMEVTCVDINEEKIQNLSLGNIPIFEPGLEEYVKRNLDYKRLFFTTDIQTAVENSDVIFIAVGTPSDEDGSTDLNYVMQAASDIGKYLNGYKVIVNKSTVPVGTGRKVKEQIQQELQYRSVSFEFDVVSNPEFLREGNAIQEFTHTERVVIGSDSEKAREIMKKVYRVLYLNQTPFVETSIETAEMIKYASNAFLAMKISYINEMANLCEAVGADVHHVAKAMGMDGRIGPKFLHPGPGYGGSCFPKDTKSIVNTAKAYNTPLTIIETVIQANAHQKHRMIEKIKSIMGTSLEGKTIAVLGITFKPRTDDMREAPSLTILPELVKIGAHLQIFDPQGLKEGPKRLKSIGHKITFCSDEYSACKNTDAIVFLTEWNQFRNLDIKRLKDTMKDFYFFDYRNMYDREYIESYGFIYDCVGR